VGRSCSQERTKCCQSPLPCLHRPVEPPKPFQTLNSRQNPDGNTSCQYKWQHEEGTNWREGRAARNRHTKRDSTSKITATHRRNACKCQQNLRKRGGCSRAGERGTTHQRGAVPLPFEGGLPLLAGQELVLAQVLPHWAGSLFAVLSFGTAVLPLHTVVLCFGPRLQLRVAFRVWLGGVPR
jgi:hypothetical protein